MHAERTGNGPSVVLVHGLGASLFTWRDVVAALAPRFTTYAVDLAGFGKTPAPPAFPYTMEAQADAVAAFMLSSSISDPILIGHSMGGGVCLHLADRASRSASFTPTRMVLISPVAYPPVGAFMGMASGQAPKAPAGSDRSPAHTMAAHFLKAAYAPGHEPTADQIDGYAAGLSTEPQILAFRRHTESLISRDRPLPSFSAVRHETLLIWGKQDRILPVGDGTRLEADLPNSSLKPIDGCGHVPHEELPQATIPEIEQFLRA